MADYSWLSTPCCQVPLWPQGEILRCQVCGVVYPYLGKDLAILVPKPQAYLTQATQALQQSLQARIKQLLKFKKYIQENPSFRTNHLKQLQQAYEHNLRLLSSVMSSIPDSILPPKEDACVGRVSYSDLDTCLNYLRRDWGVNALSQQEVATIVSRVHRLLNAYADPSQQAVFLGAGLGRFAYELSPCFKKTLAIDRSMLMGCFYHKLQQQSIDFYNIKLKNAEHNTQQCEFVHATMQPTSENLTYAVADARTLPLAKHSVCAIVSIYFTDVLPWSQLWSEVMRVLKPGGVFIHYGPLQYHFKAIQAHYSADDLRADMQSQGFVLYDEQWTSQHHLRESLALEHIYKNWSFAAIRGSQS